MGRVAGRQNGGTMIRRITVGLFSISLPALGANIVPSNLPAEFCDAVVAGDLIVGAGTLMNINTDADCDSVLPQSSGPDLCLVSRNSVAVAATGIIQASGSRALVLTAQQGFTLAGEIRAAATGITPGPGSGDFGDGGTAGSNSVGGGGAGHRDEGGKGGDASALTGAPGGASYSPTSFVPLLGGSAGGPGVGMPAASGGGGGGALQLVACQQFVLTGSATAGGGGGRGGAGVDAAAVTLPLGGAGGGSGGTILIEGDDVSIFGQACANGGAGGGGGTKATSPIHPGISGQPGTDALCAASAASGGAAASPAGSGGSGGAADLTPGPGAPSNGGGGGGGGGSAGTLGVRSCSSQTISGAVLTPSPVLGSNCSHIFVDGFDGV